MKTDVYTFSLLLDWKLIRLISQIDRFDASWASIEKKEGQSLKQLKSIATVRSVGASTRIEGAQMNDTEVENLLNHIDISKLEDRDAQEVVGYFDVLDLISEAHSDIPLLESSIQNLHNQLMRYSPKDEWHRGSYKQHSNAVEASFADGTSQVIFKTTPPGLPTQTAIQDLISWHKQEEAVHPLIKTAAFVYDFLSVHPFQDGNGRLSRLLTTLLLLKSGYAWIQYVSFEHEIERCKKEYYQTLRVCQAQRPQEEITVWVHFFLNCLINIQTKLMDKLQTSGIESQLSPKEKAIYTYIGEHAGCQSGQIAQRLQIPNPTVKRILAKLVAQQLIVKYGKGAGTNYSTQ